MRAAFPAEASPATAELPPLEVAMVLPCTRGSRPQQQLVISSPSGSRGELAAAVGAFQSPDADGAALLLAASEHMGAYQRTGLIQPSRVMRTADSYRIVASNNGKRRAVEQVAATAAKKQPTPPKHSKAEVIRLRQEAATREAQRYAAARFECAFKGCGSRLNRASDARTHARNFHGSWYESCKRRGLLCYVDRGEIATAPVGQAPIPPSSSPHENYE